MLDGTEMFDVVQAFFPPLLLAINRHNLRLRLSVCTQQRVLITLPSEKEHIPLERRPVSLRLVPWQFVAFRQAAELLNEPIGHAPRFHARADGLWESEN